MTQLDENRLTYTPTVVARIATITQAERLLEFYSSHGIRGFLEPLVAGSEGNVICDHCGVPLALFQVSVFLPETMVTAKAKETRRPRRKRTADVPEATIPKEGA